VLGNHSLEKPRHLISAAACACWHDELDIFSGLPIGLGVSVETEQAADRQGSCVDEHPETIFHSKLLGNLFNSTVSY
jgi:hypothetical protein